MGDRGAPDSCFGLEPMFQTVWPNLAQDLFQSIQYAALQDISEGYSSRHPAIPEHRDPAYLMHTIDSDHHMHPHGHRLRRNKCAENVDLDMDFTGMGALHHLVLMVFFQQGWS